MACLAARTWHSWPEAFRCRAEQRTPCKSEGFRVEGLGFTGFSRTQFGGPPGDRIRHRSIADRATTARTRAARSSERLCRRRDLGQKASGPEASCWGQRLLTVCKEAHKRKAGVTLPGLGPRLFAVRKLLWRSQETCEAGLQTEGGGNLDRYGHGRVILSFAFCADL